MSFRFIRPVGLLALALTFATPAVAFDDTTPPANGTQPPLRGPRVPPADGEGRGKGRERPAGERPAGDRARGDRPAGRAGGLDGWVAQIKALSLTPDQTAKVDALVAEFKAKSEAWTAANGEKAKELEAKAKEERAANKEASEETKKAIRELNESRPKPTEYQGKIEALLTDEQKTQLKANQDKAKSENREKRREGAKKSRENGGTPPARGRDGETTR